MRLSVFALLFFTLLAVAQGQDDLSDTEKSSVAEVLIIAEAHSPACFLLDDAYSPAMLRAVLTKYQPTAIGIESTPLLFAQGIVQPAVYGGKHVALAWAQERDVHVYGINWQRPDDLVSFAKRGLEQASARFPKNEPPTLSSKQGSARYIQKLVHSMHAEDLRDAKTHAGNNLFYWYNSEDYGLKLWKKYWDAIDSGTLDSDETLKTDKSLQLARRVDERDGHIAEHVLEVARKHSGGRLAIVLGAGHKANLEKRLLDYPEVRIVSIDKFIPLSAEEQRRVRNPIDALSGLRENLDSRLFYFDEGGVSQKRVLSMLKQLEQANVDSDEVRYLTARVHFVQQEYTQAKALLEQVVSSGREETFSYALTVDWGLSVPQMATIELGKIHDLSGHRAEAVQYDQQVLNELEESAPKLPNTAEFQSKDEWITDGRRAFHRVYSYLESRDLLRMLLREPYKLRRQRRRDRD
jgi:hypothetical protein